MFRFRHIATSGVCVLLVLSVLSLVNFHTRAAGATPLQREPASQSYQRATIQSLGYIGTDRAYEINRLIDTDVNPARVCYIVTETRTGGGAGNEAAPAIHCGTLSSRLQFEKQLGNTQGFGITFQNPFLLLVQGDFADTDIFGGDFDQLGIVDILKCVL